MGRPKAAQEGRNGGEEAKRRPGGRSKTARIEGGEGPFARQRPLAGPFGLPPVAPASAAPPTPPGGCPQAPISYQKTTRPLKRVRLPAPPFPRLWSFVIDSAFLGWFLEFPGFWRSRVSDPGFGLLGSG